MTPNRLDIRPFSSPRSSRQIALAWRHLHRARLHVFNY